MGSMNSGRYVLRSEDTKRYKKSRWTLLSSIFDSLEPVFTEKNVIFFLQASFFRTSFIFSDFSTPPKIYKPPFFGSIFSFFTKEILLRNWIFLHFSTFANTGLKILEIWDPIIQAKTRIFEFCKYRLLFKEPDFFTEKFKKNNPIPARALCMFSNSQSVLSGPRFSRYAGPGV